MADKLLEELTENTAPLTTDILYLVDDPAGSPLGQKITLANLLGGIAGSVVFNEGSGDYDFRVEGNGDANLLFCDAGTDGVGIGTATVPHGGVGYAKFALDGADGSASGPHIQATTATDNYPLLQILNWQHDNIAINLDYYFDGTWKASDATAARIYKISDTINIGAVFGATPGSAATIVSRMKISSSETAFNEDSTDLDFRVESNGNANMIFVDAGNDRVGIGDSTPSVTLDVAGTVSWVGDGTVPNYLGQGAGNNMQVNTNVDPVAGTVTDTAKSQWKLILGAALDTFTVRRSPAGATYTETTRLTVSGLGNIVPTQAALATNATDGFIYIPTCAGAPTGTPTAYTGTCAIVFDTTNNKLYVYDGGWIDTT